MTKSYIVNFERIRMVANGIAALATDVKGNVSRFQDGCSLSYYYGRFQVGCSSQMGTEKCQDQALSLICYKWMLTHINEKKIKSFKDSDNKELSKWTIRGAYLAISYVLGFGGHKGFLMDLSMIMKNKTLKDNIVNLLSW